jgi:hypothetical protein
MNQESNLTIARSSLPRRKAGPSIQYMSSEVAVLLFLTKKSRRDDQMSHRPMRRHSNWIEFLEPIVPSRFVTINHLEPSYWLGNSNAAATSRIWMLGLLFCMMFVSRSINPQIMQVEICRAQTRRSFYFELPLFKSLDAFMSPRLVKISNCIHELVTS